MKYVVAFATFAVACGVAAGGGGWAILWAWPAVAFLAVAAAYAGAGSRVLGKRPDGRLGMWAVLLWLPYFLFAWATWHVWRRLSREPIATEVVPGLWVGRRPLAGELPPGVERIVDLTAEFAEPRARRTAAEYVCLPTLDGAASDERAFFDLADRLAADGRVTYVHCAQGHGRSAALVVAVLVGRGVDDAEALVRRARPGVRLSARQRRVVDRYAVRRAGR